jgi:hypothetical protein
LGHPPQVELQGTKAMSMIAKGNVRQNMAASNHQNLSQYHDPSFYLTARKWGLLEKMDADCGQWPGTSRRQNGVDQYFQ